jgi:hypothetical protein
MWSLLTSPSADKLRHERTAVAGWPSVTGVLYEVRLEESKVGTKGVPYYYARARYGYDVDGVEYEGSQIGTSKFMDAYRDHHPEVLESKLHRFFTAANVVQREATDNGLPVWNEKTIILRLNDQPVPVFYNPANPASSLLDPVDPDAVSTWRIVRPFFFMFLLGLFMMAAAAFVYWSVCMPAKASGSRASTSKDGSQSTTPDGIAQEDRQERARFPSGQTFTKSQPEPVRNLVTRDVHGGSHDLRAGTYVWVVGTSIAGNPIVEQNDERFEVPASSLSDTPVPAPMNRLIQLDSCFSERTSLKQVYVDNVNMFTILECRHGNLFLEDTITGVAWYSRLIFIGQLPREVTSYRSFWERHHTLSTDELHLRGIAL